MWSSIDPVSPQILAKARWQMLQHHAETVGVSAPGLPVSPCRKDFLLARSIIIASCIGLRYASGNGDGRADLIVG